MATPQPHLTSRTEAGVMTITLDRPERLNAVDPHTVVQLIEALDLADSDGDVRVVIVTGNGRAFCAGADMSVGSDPFHVDQHVSEPDDGGGRLSLRLAAMTRPMIAAINGPAIGIGAAMTLPMDWRIASETARFAFPYVRRGISPEGCSSWFLPRVVGINRALDWMLSGRTFSAAEALEAGLIGEVVREDALLRRCYEIAREITDVTSPIAVAATRRLLWSQLGPQSPEQAHRTESRLLAKITSQPDVAEGVAAFKQRRPPKFTSRATPEELEAFGLDYRPNDRSN